VECFQRHLLPSTSTCGVDEIRIGCKSEDCPYVKFNPKKADRWALLSPSLFMTALALPLWINFSFIFHHCFQCSSLIW
jgi:hypothetical protein